jgi:hypothetical protein
VLIKPQNPVLAYSHVGNFNKLSFYLDPREDESALVPVLLSLSCVVFFFFSDTYKAKIGVANR